MHALCSNTKLVKETMYKGKISQIFNALLVFSYQVSRVEVNGCFGLLEKPTVDVRGKS